MDTFTRRFERITEETLAAGLDGFPGTFRVYGTDRSTNFIQLHVEFKTDDRAAAHEFLENLETCLT